MPRKRRPARLWLEERPTGAVWVILDGGRKIRTGFSEAEHAKAERALQAHIVSKHEVTGERNAGRVSIAETLAYYVAEHVPTVRRPDVIERSMPALIEWWQGKTVADVKKSACNRYVKWRTGADREQPNPDPKSEDTARRDLVVLEAAINFYHEEFVLSAVPAVVKPREARDQRRLADAVPGGGGAVGGLAGKPCWRQRANQRREEECGEAFRAPDPDHDLHRHAAGSGAQAAMVAEQQWRLDRCGEWAALPETIKAGRNQEAPALLRHP